MNIFDLNGKVAVVTGGYGHLGTAMTTALLQCGANVVVAGRSPEKFAQVFGEDTDRLHFEPIDICSSESIRACFVQIRRQFGRIDILVNNAHATRGRSQEQMSDDDWAYTMEAVVGSVHKCIREIMPLLKEQQGGKIINIASMYGLISPDFDSLYLGEGCEKYTNPPHYGAAKAAMIQLTKYYAVLLGKYRVQVNAIAPGPFPKPSIQQENPEFIERLKRKNPLRQIGQPNDLAGVIALLSSGASNFITGQTIQVDGGWTIW